MLIINLLKRLRIPPPSQISRFYSQQHVPKPLRSLKAKSTRDSVQFYVDSCRVRTVAGNGGDGCISFLSVWCKDQAGPDGGDGGHGGHVIFQGTSLSLQSSINMLGMTIRCDLNQRDYIEAVIKTASRKLGILNRVRRFFTPDQLCLLYKTQATHTVKSLNHCKSVMQAKHGERGFNKDCHGKNADHVFVLVPLGTIVKDSSGVVVADLNAEGVLFVAARGGSGGRGNRFFLTDTEQAPDVAELGARGESISYSLEVRSMAHVGLLGAPNAGKSTLLRAVTRARPTVAAYPFTTLRPHLGMVPYDDYEQVAIADLPGLIPGSHKNYGLGIQFLQHVERCKGLIYLLDGANDPLQQYKDLAYEIKQYSSELATRPSVIVVNKIDLLEARRCYEEMREKMDVIGISAKTGLNLRELLKVVRVMYDREGEIEMEKE